MPGFSGTSRHSEAAVFEPYLAYLPISGWDEINLADIELRYDFNAADPDIGTRNLSISGTYNGVFAGTVNHTDPQIVNQNVNTYGDGQEVLLMRLKTGVSGDWQLFWKRGDDTGFSAARSVWIPVSASADFQIVSVDLSGLSDWEGQNITAWRLDPAGSEVPYDFEIDYLYFGSALDFDGDGLPNDLEGMADRDGDGLPNLADTDSNGDGYSDQREHLLGFDAASDDSDGDGMSNDWEIQYGFDPYDNLEAAWDLDGDGYDSLAEYITLTDPLSAIDYITVDFAGITNALINGRAGRTYTLKRSTNLLSNDWVAVDVVSADVDAPVMLVDTNQSEHAFYKVYVEK